MSTQTTPKRKYIAPDIELYEVRMDERVAVGCNASSPNWAFWEQDNDTSCWDLGQETIIGS